MRASQTLNSYSAARRTASCGGSKCRERGEEAESLGRRAPRMPANGGEGRGGRTAKGARRPRLGTLGADPAEANQTLGALLGVMPGSLATVRRQRRFVCLFQQVGNCVGFRLTASGHPRVFRGQTLRSSRCVY